jgi:4-amino-4-deoxy-L-arabinose transferase-like glycosyltransferase
MRVSVPLILFAVALLVRLLFNVFVMGLEDSGLELFPDGKEYDALGLSLAEGSGYARNQSPDTYRPPGYPLFLAAAYVLFGHSVAAVKILQSILDAATCVMILLIGERLFTRRVGVIAGLIAAVYPFLIVYTGFVLSEALFVFLSTGFLYALVRFREDGSWRWLAVAGLLLGGMNLTRPAVLLLPVLLFCWLWVELGTKRRAAVIAAVLALWMLVPILPWTVRNYLVRQSFILIADHHWVALYAANNPRILQDPDKIGGWIQPQGGEDYRAEYLAFIRHTVIHEPLELVRLEFHKLHRLWSIVPTSSRTTFRDTLISFCSYGVLLPFFVGGMALSLKMPQTPWLLFFWILNFCLMALILYGSTRFRSPIEPALVIFSAHALDRAWFKWAGSPGLRRVA